MIVGCLSLFLNGVILAARGQASLGIFNQVLSIYIILSQIAVCGVQFSVLHQCSWHPDNMDKCWDSLLSGLFLVVGISSVVSFILFFSAGFLADVFSSPSLEDGVKNISWGIVLFCCNKVGFLFLNAIRHMRALAVFQAVRFVLIVGFVLAGMWAAMADGSLSIALSISEAVLFVLMMGYIHGRVFHGKLTRPLRFFHLVRSHLSFGVRGCLSGVLVEMNTRTDILMLGLFVSDARVGLYSFVAAFAEGFSQLIVAMRRNVDPLLGNHFSLNDICEIEKLSANVKRKFYPFMFGVGVILICVFPFIFRLLDQTANIQESVLLLSILVGVFVLISGYNCFIGVLIQGGFPGLFTIVMLLTVLANILLNFFLIPFLGVYGAAGATGAAYLIQTIICIYMARRFLGVRI